MCSNLQIRKPFILTVPYFTKTDIPAVPKGTKEIPMRHLILTANKFRKKKTVQFSVPWWIYLATTIPTLTV